MDFEYILNLGVEKEIIDENQKNNLIDLFNQNNEEFKQISTVVKVFYYIGGFIMLCAMVALMSNTIQNSTYTMILLLGAFYAALFFGAGEFLWKKNEKLPAGILYFLFIAVFGFIVMDIEKMTGFFPHFSDIGRIPNYWELCRYSLVLLSSTTIVANTILQKCRPVSLLALPTIFCSLILYIICIDFIFDFERLSTDAFCWINLIFWTGLLFIAFIKDHLTKVDYSKWMYFIGLIGFYLSVFLLFAEHLNSEWQYQLLNLIISLSYILAGLLIQRKPFSIIGILGVIEYIMYLEFSNLENNTILLTCVVLLTGLIILYAGVIYNKNVDILQNFIESKLPESVKKYLPQNRV